MKPGATISLQQPCWSGRNLSLANWKDFQKVKAPPTGRTDVFLRLLTARVKRFRFCSATSTIIQMS